MLRILSLTALLSVVSLICNAQDWAKKISDPSVNFYDVQSSFNAYWKKAERKEKFKAFFQLRPDTEKGGDGFKMYKRWEHFVEQRVFADDIPRRSTARERGPDSESP